MSRKREAKKEAARLARGSKSAGRGSVLRKVARAGASRRKLQSLILVLVTAGSVAAALLAAQLLAGVAAPFDHAFARQQGSELSVAYDGAKASRAQVAGTAHANGVTAAAGPYSEVEIDRTNANIPNFDTTDFPLPPMTVVGRANSGGSVDDVDVTQGSWPTANNQIVVADNSSILSQANIGSVVDFPQLPGDPHLTIVGFATSVSQTADAWVLPGEISALTAPGASPGYQMLYRFADAGTQSAMTANQSSVAAAAPAGAVRSTQSWLALQSASSNGGNAIIPPFLAAFGVLGVILAVIILSSVIGATIGASSRRIGVLKAVGCTPGQVVRTYCMQALIPCVIGVVLGTLLGTEGAYVLLHSTDEALDTGTPQLNAGLEILVPLAALALISVTAVLAAGRAGRMSVLEALASGHTPKAGRGRTAQRLLARSPLPRSISLGLAAPFTRPARAIALTVAVVFGVVAATFALGVSSSLDQATADVAHSQGGIQVEVDPQLSGPPTAADAKSALAAIEAQPGTEAYEYDISYQMPVSNVSPDAMVTEYYGQSDWVSYQVISGHWLTGDGQAVVPTALLRATGLHLGDKVTATLNGKSFPLTIVGEVFDTRGGGMEVLTEGSNFAGVQAQIPVGGYNVELKPGTDQASYLSALNRSLAPAHSSAGPAQQGGGKLKLIMGALSVMMTLMLILVAALGVIGSVVLDTRERVHDIGIYKALGMTPRQTSAMVLTSVLSLGVVAGLIGVPLGVLLHGVVMPMMGNAVHSTLPVNVIVVYHGLELFLLAAGGVLIALIGAVGPASWAGRIRTATALRTE